MSKFSNQEKYERKMRDNGMVKVSAWVPEINRKELLEIAEEMRDEQLERLRTKKTRKNALTSSLV